MEGAELNRHLLESRIRSNSAQRGTPLRRERQRSSPSREAASPRAREEAEQARPLRLGLRGAHS